MAIQRRFEFVAERLLVEMAQCGSLEAYDELVYRFRDAVLLFARQNLDPCDAREVAQDAAQESFLAAYKALGQLQDPERFGSWLYTITRHRARRIARQRGRQRATEPTSLDGLLVEPIPSSDDEAPGDPLKTLLRAEQQETIRTILASIPREYQIVLQLFYYEQWTAVRIADFLSLPLTTVKWRLRYGRQQIQKKIEETTWQITIQKNRYDA